METTLSVHQFTWGQPPSAVQRAKPAYYINLTSVRKSKQLCHPDRSGAKASAVESLP